MKEYAFVKRNGEAWVGMLTPEEALRLSDFGAIVSMAPYSQGVATILKERKASQNEVNYDDIRELARRTLQRSTRNGWIS